MTHGMESRDSCDGLNVSRMKWWQTIVDECAINSSRASQARRLFSVQNGGRSVAVEVAIGGGAGLGIRHSLVH